VWSPAVTGTFVANTSYTATITLTTKAGYTLQGVGANSFTVTGATVNNAADSGVVTATFPATVAAAPVVPVVTLEPDNTKIHVSWTAVDDAVSYQVVWGTGLNAPPNPLTAANSVDNIQGTTYTIPNLQNGNVYSVWVRGKKANSTYADYSEKKTATPMFSDAPPAKPVVTVTPTDDGQLKISWPEAKGATNYDVRVSVQNDIAANPTLVAANVTTTEVTTGTGNIQGVPAGGPLYYVWVTAKNVTLGGQTQTTHSDSQQVTIVEFPVNAAAFAGTTWKSGAGATFTFAADGTLVYTPAGGNNPQDGSYTYANPPALNLTVGNNAVVNINVTGKTFTYSGAKFTKQ
jgi:hypothetical protein